MFVWYQYLHCFFNGFVMENGSKRYQKVVDVVTIFIAFSQPFRKIEFLMDYGKPLAHFWQPFCCTWLLWFTFATPFAALGSFWRPIGFTMGCHFLTFWIPWRDFGSIRFYLSFFKSVFLFCGYWCCVLFLASHLHYQSKRIHKRRGHQTAWKVSLYIYIYI